ncbi:hypothetical protein HER32_02095 [Hymenobacter sp. BT18]|uniref:enhanced serine sensitivity protein SseB C-terminal domain-containing protein n=1 Tax=Hymenobacter sp. BT18 TaxID=2835648 RepID=UPI00143EA7D7|nr:enhanced serine sensitivity protein SseB C-terminal domain-containing protein [Hymenobacter sp. BT18]QIX60043.1 hypothetical protein HER32_02095 [Hymenobacter sp. BT18]
MGLFDFLKKKNDEATPAPTTPPAAPGKPEAGTPETPAAAERKGPRYSRPQYTSPTATPAPVMPPMPVSPVPPMPPQPAFEPQNALEEALMRAANEPQFRPIFYQELLGHELIILPLPSEGRDSGEITIEPGSEVKLQMLNDNKLPVFSSLERVFEGGIVPEGVPYLRMRGFDFFNMVRGAECVLNPFSPVGKLLTNQELEDLLSGTLNEEGPQGLAPDTRVQLSQPAEYPTALAESIRKFSMAQPLVQAVYLAQMQVEGTPEPSRLLLGFQIEGEDASFLQEMGPFVQPYLQEGQLVDMMVLNPDPNDPLAGYFRQTEPVYQKA